MLITTMILPLLLTTFAAALLIDSNSAPTQILKFYDQKIPFDRVAQVIINQTAVNPSHTPSDSEILLLNSIENELKSVESIDFNAIGGVCNPNSIKSSIEQCDRDASYIHEVCSQSAVGNDSLTCQPAMVSTANTYLQKRGIVDPQTDAIAYVKFADILGNLNISNPVRGLLTINTTKAGAINHFGVLNK
jgi:hypothetical protein